MLINGGHAFWLELITDASETDKMERLIRVYSVWQRQVFLFTDPKAGRFLASYLFSSSGVTIAEMFGFSGKIIKFKK